MRLVISSDRYIEEIWDYCTSDRVELWQGRYYSIDSGHDPFGWQIVVEPSARLDLLILKYSEWISVVVQG
jgi:hypothetical protein